MGLRKAVAKGGSGGDTCWKRDGGSAEGVLQLAEEKNSSSQGSSPASIRLAAANKSATKADGKRHDAPSG
jgi:hypothetical protein